ncbi:uncharacterized protein RCC_03008 [Ramularia collo-cygni]|uniref:Uncharacterized protein n=1 Tax=Ramularia collo-cygni TaxID=112498 RepID=A0A2D3UTE3_9PEZI|nr:uncharacterized protein RCC_03008 [Ramularia collo-cygni]CZT17175.1 uncharacterized protein RCC_03008 [Ramularia collo-cygni]
MSNNNATVALPGHRNWDVWWSPESGFDNFQLDIVGFLAVLGESSVTANAQVAALSRLFYLPRLLPAPQALLRTSRPTTLIPREAKVTGVHSGNVKDHVHHVANVLLGEPMEKYTVQHVTIQKKVRNPDHVQTSISDILFRGISRKARASTDQTVLPSPVKAKATGPLFWVTMIGFFSGSCDLVRMLNHLWRWDVAPGHHPARRAVYCCWCLQQMDVGIVQTARQGGRDRRGGCRDSLSQW